VAFNSARDKFQKIRQSHWDQLAENRCGSYYHKRIAEIYQHLVPSESRVAEIGCGNGDLLAAVKPGFGLGVDFSKKVIRSAIQRYPDLYFLQCDAHRLSLKPAQEFDVVILSDLVNDLWDVQKVFEQIMKLSVPHTRIILNAYSRLWEIPLTLAQKLGLAKPMLPQNWLTKNDIKGLLNIAGFEVIRTWSEMVWPFYVPLLARFVNRFIARFWPFHFFSLTNFIIARPVPTIHSRKGRPTVSVIIPARNERENIAHIFSRTPEMGRKTELVFIEGHSTDNTYSVIEKTMRAYPERPCRLFRQPGEGKGDAVRAGFSQATGEILMILDADLTVPPGILPRFFEVLNSGKGEFVNGVRLVYPREERSMRYLNMIGNKVFAIVFSWLLEQPIKDTLCGTKVLWKRDYNRIAENRSYFGEFDPFGDFDLLFGAAKLNLKIVEIPVRYGERTYGNTNIQRWKHGWLLVKMVWFAAKRIKFV